MRTLPNFVLPITFVAILSSSAVAQGRGDEHTRFFNRETSVWETVKNKEMAPLEKVFAVDYVGTYESGIIGKKDELSEIGQTTLRSAKMDDFKVHHVDDMNVLVTYKATVDGDMNGKSISGTYNTLSVWHRSGNQWYVAAHSEVKAQ